MLNINHIVLRFGGLVAVNDVSLTVERGKITGIIGPNGAGKTTLFNCISGVYTPYSGTIEFDNAVVSGKMPYQISEHGISRTYQVINLFWEMTLIENVLVGMHTQLKSSFWKDLLRLPSQRQEEKAAYREAQTWLEFIGLSEHTNDKASSLPYGKQRLLEIVRALAGHPKLILLDEPAAGMNSKEKEELDILLKKILGLGITILIIEHDMKLMMGVSDYIYVLNDGKLLAEGTPKSVLANPDVITAYLGE